MKNTDLQVASLPSFESPIESQNDSLNQSLDESSVVDPVVCQFRKRRADEIGNRTGSSMVAPIYGEPISN
jgi:hypothetical protein